MKKTTTNSSLALLVGLGMAASAQTHATDKPATLPVPQTGERPNILFIICDDLNHWVGALGVNPQTKTPNIDRFAKQSVNFTQAHCAVPLCNPSRCAIMSGRRASSTGVYTNENLPWASYIDETKCLDGYLKANGYYTAGAGKIYHVGGRGAGERSEGTQWDKYGLATSEEGEGSRNRKDKPSKRGGDSDNIVFGQIEIGKPDIPDNQTGDNAIARWAVSQLRKKHDKPFFIAAGFHKPHLPLIVPKKYFDMFPLETIQLPPHLANDADDLPPAGKAWTNSLRWRLLWGKGGDAGIDRWKQVVQAYLAAVAYADAQIGIILDALEKSPYKNNTIVVVMADHGYHFGEKQHIGKTTLWDESTHVPFLWRVPGVTPAGGANCARTVESFSVFPTLCDLVGLPKPDYLQSVSVKPLLENPKAEWTRPAVTTFEYKNHTVRSEQWRYIRYANGDEELYDEKNDPYEWRNLATDSKYDSIKKDLAKWLPTENVPNKVSENKAPASKQQQRGAKRNAGAKGGASKNK